MRGCEDARVCTVGMREDAEVKVERVEAQKFGLHHR